VLCSFVESFIENGPSFSEVVRVIGKCHGEVEFFASPKCGVVGVSVGCVSDVVVRCWVFGVNGRKFVFLHTRD